METEPLPAAEVVENARRLADACRELGILVVLVRVALAADGRDALAPEADESRAGGERPAGWEEIVPELGPRAGDLVVTKRQWGAFYGTELDLELRRRGIRTLLVGGIATSFGVESTVRDAYERGYEQVLVPDAMAALSAEEHDYPLRRVFPRVGRVRTTDEVLAAL